MLALKPCWAMSPLVVSQLLPPLPYFDVVIFDEASQITPADAVTSILRGRQLVVAGDNKQLPPTAFFVSDSTEDDSDQPEPEAPAPLMAGTSGFESILDALGSVLRFRQLLWHYRSRDERLIAFSNAHIYDRTLITFPGISGGRVLRYVPAAWQPGADTNSPAPEVDAAVDLILEHARARPEESLGVITMGIRHRDRIEERLRQRLRDDPELAGELAEFFDENRDEPFFVKNLERVQGDERDAIILSIGYGKDTRGGLPYRFGPLLTEGGERRLNVAVTRAKNRITLVSSFSSRDMDPERSAAEGVKLLRQYLQYVESDGTNLGDYVLDKPSTEPVRGRRPRHPPAARAEADRPVRNLRLLDRLRRPAPHPAGPLRPGHRMRRRHLPLLPQRPRPRPAPPGTARTPRLALPPDLVSRMVPRQRHLHQKAITAYHAAVRAADEGEQATLARDPDESEPGTLLQTAYEAALSRTTPAPPALGQRIGPRPWITPGQPIEAYSDAELLKLAQWIRSDDILRTQDELLQEMMRELGFQRRGKNVVARLTAAITQSAASAPGHHGLPPRLQAEAAAYRRAGTAQSARAGFRAFRGQRKSKTSTGVGEDQHTNNTKRAALPGTRRHACYESHASAVTNKNADELG